MKIDRLFIEHNERKLNIGKQSLTQQYEVKIMQQLSNATLRLDQNGEVNVDYYVRKGNQLRNRAVRQYLKNLGRYISQSLHPKANATVNTVGKMA